MTEKKKQSEPFAPLAKVPKDAKDKELLTKQLAAIKVPTRKQVGVPPYPGAVIAFAIEGTKMELHGSNVRMLPVIKLLSKDSVADVVAFYVKALPDWTHKDLLGSHELRPPKSDEARSTVSTGRPFVRVMMAQGEILLPDAASRIEIAYDETLAAKPKRDR